MHRRSPGRLGLSIAWIAAFGWAVVVALLLGAGLAPSLPPARSEAGAAVSSRNARVLEAAAATYERSSDGTSRPR